MTEELKKALEDSPDNPFLQGHVEALTNAEDLLSPGCRVKVVSHSTYKGRSGTITKSNGISDRWFVAIDDDDRFAEVSFYARELIYIPENAKVVAPPPMESGGVETEKLLGGCPPTPCSTEFLVSYRDVWVINIEGKEWWVAKDNGELIEAINLPNGSLQRKMCCHRQRKERK